MPVETAKPGDIGISRAAGSRGRKSIRRADSRDAESVFRAAWGSISVSLWEYRQGHFDKSIEWAHRCLSYPVYNAPRAATADLELSMAMDRLGKKAESLNELGLARQLIDSTFNTTFDPGSASDGFWFDWLFARILLQEASK